MTPAIGAKPVLVTPLLTRRQWDKDRPDKIKSSLAPYSVEVRKIAAEKHVLLADASGAAASNYARITRPGKMASGVQPAQSQCWMEPLRMTEPT